MGTIKYLSQVINLEKDLERAEERLIRLEQSMIYASPTGKESTGATASAPNPNKLANQIAEKELLELKIEKIKKDIDETRHRLMRQIDSLRDHDSCDVLYMRYIRGHNFKKIGEIMERKTSWVYYKHETAVNQMSEVIQHYQRLTPKRYKLIDMNIMNEVARGTMAEMADKLNTTIQNANALYNQKLPRNKHIIVDENATPTEIGKVIDRNIK